MKKRTCCLTLLLLIMLALRAAAQDFPGVGAVTPFICYEAEQGTLAGGATVVALTNAPADQYSSPELEASGHAYVRLNATGQSVTWTNTSGQNFTALNLRSCIPDAPNGGGLSNTINLYVNGQFRQAFSVNSLQSYCYEGTNYNGQADKNPADGHPRGFWNDTHAFITGAPVAPGDTLTFQKDAANTAAYYYLDVVDLENPPAPLAQPPNSLSIMDYGAVSNNPAIDNTTAINNCFIAAQSQGKTAWIPPGTFYFSAIKGGLKASGITIQGAGMWYSTLYRVTPAGNNQGVANMVTTTSGTLQDVLLDCNASNRAGNNNNGAVNFSGNHWLVNRVWIQHATSAFWCSGNGGMACNCRVLSVWSDGGNFNNVEGSAGIGMNLTYSNNFVRGTGDDAMAINSVNYNTYGTTTYYYTTMSNIAYVNNTAIAAWGGKNMAIYGGINQYVANNLLHDNARYVGLGVGKFGVNGSDLYSARVIGNVVLRGGGNGYNQQQPAMMIGNGGDGHDSGTIGNAYCVSNTIMDATYSGIGFTSCTNIVLQYNTITHPAQDGIAVGGGSLGANVTGNALIYSNTVTGLSARRLALTNYVTGFAAIVPIAATSYSTANNMAAVPCVEGGQSLKAYAWSSCWAAYSGINLTGVNTFVARVAGGTAEVGIKIHLDSPTGTLLGTCTVPGTENYVNTYCSLINITTGTHTIYLDCSIPLGTILNGTSSALKIEYFGLYTAPPMPSQQLVPGNTYALKLVSTGKYVTAPNNGASALAATSTTIGKAEQFKIVDMSSGNIAFQSLANSNYVCADNNGSSPLIANRASPGSWETFTEFDAGGGNIALRAGVNGSYIAVPQSQLIASSAALSGAAAFTIQFVTGAPPAAPANLVAAASNRRVDLTWRPVTGATSYNVKRSTSSSGTYTTLATGLTSTAFTDTSVNNGTLYYYVVTALNPAGESVNSVPAAALPGTLSRVGWVASCNTSGGDDPGNALDGNLTTRWSTGGSQAPGQWFQVDMGSPQTFNQIVLNSANSSGDYPRGYQVFISNDGINWGNPIATGSGTSAITTITFSPQAAEYIRVTQTASQTGNYWSIHEFYVFGAPPFAPTLLGANLTGSGQVSLLWRASVGADGYNVERAAGSIYGTYVTVAVNVPGLAYTDTGLTNGVTYYYAVSATNSYGRSPTSSPIISVRPLATDSPSLTWTQDAGQIKLSWPADHLGWILEMQTNSLDTGLGANWDVMQGSDETNVITLPLDTSVGSVFFRLARP